MAVGLILPAARRRRTAWLRFALIVAGVLLAHAWLAQRVADDLGDWNRDAEMPARMEVAYVRDMALSAPPPSAAAAAPQTLAPAAAPAARAASAPRAAVPKKIKAAEVPPPPLAEAAPEEVAAEASSSVALSASSAATIEPPVPPEAAASAAADAMAVAAAAATVPASAPASASGPPFEWPVSTRMTYVVTGNYRGPVHGGAQVEWIRMGSRYQVHLDLLVGPSFAPLITRKMSSDGEITAAGLAPRRYDQETKVVMRDPQHVTIAFDPDGITLANGDRRPPTPGMQDTASQFVQLTYVFSTRPEQLRLGGTVDIPLALPHKVDIWTYDVVDEQTLYTDFGPLPAVHLTPRRKGPPRAGELSAEIWFAPQLRYLPVRIKIQQDAENYVDLLIAKPPEIAGS